MPISLAHPKQSLHDEFRWFFRQSRAPKLRTMRQFAEEEIIIPKGPYVGRRFRCDRQPYSRLWFDSIDSGLWTTHVATGPSQSGKTLCGYVTPTLYHLFEMGETTILGLPDMNMAQDKWEEDLLPVIERTRYGDLLPDRGEGSRGGSIKSSVRFKNGATLKFMSGGGHDKSRAAYTARVLVITETDGLDTAGETSREADKVAQLIARTESFGDRKRIYMECTLTDKRGRTWREYMGGTQSRIVVPCPDCGAMVTPEREHLIGWRESENEIDAAQKASFCCPQCGSLWNDDIRRFANEHAELVHDNIQPTTVFAMRWSAFNNMFWTTSHVAAREWKASRDPDEDNAEKEMRQFVWALPYEPPILEDAPLDPDSLMKRTQKFPRGYVPPNYEIFCGAIDVGKRLCHYVLPAFNASGNGHVVDYARFEVASDDLGTERALLAALRDFRDKMFSGWAAGQVPLPVGQVPSTGGQVQSEGTSPGIRIPNMIWIDAGWQTDVVCSFCREKESAGRFMPYVGRGTNQQRMQFYTRPKTTGSVVIFIGEEYHISKIKSKGVYLIEINSDFWKSWLHHRLIIPQGSTGSISFFDAMPNEHLAFVKHLTAEKEVTEFVPGRGTVRKWVVERRSNHFLDAFYAACTCAHYCGLRAEGIVRKATPKSEPETRTQPAGEESDSPSRGLAHMTDYARRMLVRNASW